MTRLLYPQARLNITGALEDLADTVNQQRTWINREMTPPGKAPSFGDVVNWLFDDSGLEDSADPGIGEIFYDQEEDSRIRQVMERINQLFARYGKGLPDKDYVSKPEWPALVDDSRACLELFESNDRKYGGATG